ncbi:(d)CMP kinase, partial [Brevundimonas sp.]|uniref:(d)CMP kinase n=1 Tax=Brevundimonas sp. TaxID=1871086 RepID=UPI003918235F
MTLIIAVDGPAASGKGTIAARLAQTYGLPHLDTGLLYRAVGARVLADGGSLDDEVAAAQAARGLDAAGLSDDPRLTT